MDQVYFDGSLTGLTTMQLADILFVNPTGFSPGSYGTKILPNGEIVPFIPVPEPATYVAGVTSLAVVGIAEWRRRRERDLRASWAGQATEFAEFDGLEV